MYLFILSAIIFVLLFVIYDMFYSVITDAPFLLQGTVTLYERYIAGFNFIPFILGFFSTFILFLIIKYILRKNEEKQKMNKVIRLRDLLCVLGVHAFLTIEDSDVCAGGYVAFNCQIGDIDFKECPEVLDRNVLFLTADSPGHFWVLLDSPSQKEREGVYHEEQVFSP